jgi:hypothetical protein
MSSRAFKKQLKEREKTEQFDDDFDEDFQLESKRKMKVNPFELVSGFIKSPSVIMLRHVL